MAGELTRAAYGDLIKEDLEWLLRQPRTLERDHIEAVLRHELRRRGDETMAEQETELDRQVLQAVRSAMAEAVKSKLTGLHNPIAPLVTRVVDRHATSLTKLIDSAFTDAINDEQFRETVRTSIRSKLAKSLVDKAGGEIEKKVNELKSNPETRARITVALSNAVDSLLRPA